MDALIAIVGHEPTTGSRIASLRTLAARMPHRGRWMDRQVVGGAYGAAARIECYESANVGIPIGPRIASDAKQHLLLCGYVTRIHETGECGGRVTETLLSRYQRHGIAGMSVVQGAFLIAIVDDSQQIVHLVRDGAGMRTMFYGRVRDEWLIASEPKAITGEGEFVKKIRPAAIAQYLSFSFTPGAGTMLEGMYEIPCGHAVSLTKDEPPAITNLFPFENEEPAAPSSRRALSTAEQQHWIDRTRDSVAAAVAARLPRGEPVGVFLSGGLDSSIVAAEVARQHDAPVRTYAIHFGTQYPNELKYARAVAERCGTIHHEILIRPQDFVPRMKEMIWHLDDPIGDPITQPNFELARRVSQDVRWVFNGEGGDPVLGGPKNIPMMLQHWYGVPRTANFREQAYLASYRRAYDECVALLHDDIREQIDWSRDLESLLTPLFHTTPPRSFLNKLMAINIRLKGAHLILPKVERMLAASGLTPLSPLFDEDLIRLSFQMPTSMKLRHGIEKWVLKRAYEDRLPAAVIARPKSGMRVPVHYWFRGEMRAMAKRTLNARRLRRDRILNPDRVKQLLRYDIDEGAGRYGIRLWMLLTFEMWRQQTMPSNARPTHVR